MRRLLLLFGSTFLTHGELQGDVLISEFLADNEEGIRDENGEREDWIELTNTGTAAVNLDGWWLSDDSLDKRKWRIPAVGIPANGTLLVWASGKDRTDPAAPLHTNFSLSKSGGFLGLYHPHPATGAPVRADTLGASYPVQVPDISYGIAFSQSTATLVASGQSGRYKVLPNNATGAAQYAGANYAGGDLGTGLAGGWNVSPGFNDSTWTAGPTGVGYDSNGGLGALIGADCRSALQNVNPSLCFRRTFSVPDPAVHATYKLRMKYEDGFVAWLNGVEVGRANAPATPAHNSTAAANLDEAIVGFWTEFTIPAALVAAGTNLLAIQGMNITAGSSDFLILPEITASSGLTAGEAVYFSPPGPGTLNGSGSAGPVVHDPTPADPAVPRPAGNPSSPAMKVTVRVIRTRHNVASVRAYHRTMWNGESAAVALNDSGTGADTTAGDGIYSAHLPTGGAGPGQMFRWRFEARDSAGNLTKLPAFADPLDSPQYFGSVAADASEASSRLPVLHQFIADVPAAGTEAGTRCALYYLGRFYDNVGIDLHGQSTAAFGKKSHNFDFNADHRFVWSEGAARPAKDIDLLSNHADKTRTRNTLAQEVSARAGCVHHFAFPVRVHRNAAFHGVLDLVEDGDDRMLERNGLDPEGALYKMYDSLASTGNAEKKTRRDEDKSDLQALIDGLNPATALATRRIWAYDHVNLAATANYLAVRAVTSDRDHGHKNYYVYRDSERSREWRPLIWDVDLTFGHDWNSGPGYLDDTIYHVNPIRHGQTDVNRLYRIMAEVPEFRAIYLRRLRSLMDGILEPPGTVDGFLETRMRGIVASIDPDPANPSPWTDGDLDFAQWGTWGRGLRPREETEHVIAQHFGPRRAFLFNTHSATRQRFGPGAGSGDPIPDLPQVNTPGLVTIESVDFLPVSNNAAEEYLILKNHSPHAVDLSGWTVAGGIDHVFEGGTVIPPGPGTPAAGYLGLLHLAKDASAFRGRTSGPSGGQGRLVQGGYSGQLSARGETVELRDPAGQRIATFSYAGTPSDLQRQLRIGEIQYHPAAPTAAEELAIPFATEDDFEYLELVNLGPSALQLAGARFTDGIAFNFPAHALAAGGRLVLAKNPAAFALRHPATTVAVLGPYDGVLANSGETLRLVDAAGENILDFEYKDGWYPATDGGGRALVLRDPATPHDRYGDPVVWAISGGDQGSPGVADASLAQAYFGWDNFHFTAAERDDPAVAGPDADADGDGRTNAEEYALGSDPRAADLPRLEFTWSMDGAVRRPALRFRRPAGALDLSYELLGGSDLAGWPVVATGPVASGPLPGDLEEVVFRDSADDRGSQRFLKLRYVPVP
jgi:hypothetical protein